VKLTTCDVVLLETRQEPIRGMFDTSEANNGKVTDVGADIAFKPDIAYMTFDDLRAHPQEGVARGGTGFEPDKE
jgi:hypothetical protein